MVSPTTESSSGSPPEPRAKVRFESGGSGFHAVVKERVERYFEDAAVDKHANAAMVHKSLFWLGLSVALYVVLMANVLPALVALPVGLTLGFCLACVGFNIGHDAIHGAYSRRAWINELLGWSFQILGASAYTWSVAHNVVHHTYTNIPGADGDIEPGPLLRFHTGHPARPAYRFQHLYAWFLYCFVSLVWVFVKDFVQLATRDARTGKRASPAAWLSVVAAKALHVVLFVVLPLVLVELALWQLALGYLLMHFVAGFTLSIVFQLAHVVEGPLMPSAAARGVGRTWAEHQLLTTANFSRSGRIAQFICGGLSYQIEHHLFPRVCHIHYPAIARIVEETAREHALPYHEHPSFWAALKSHARMLKHLGTAPQRAVAA